MPSVSATPTCSLPDVLNLAGQRSNELIEHLQNFSAHERIRFEQTDRQGTIKMYFAAKFDYTVEFGDPSGWLNIHENRARLAGTNDENLIGSVGKALPALARIFYPGLQSDYEMRCEGFTHWNEKPAWLVHFRQIKGKRPRTMTVRPGGIPILEYRGLVAPIRRCVHGL